MTAFRYEFGERVEIPEVEASLLLALWATESLHGESNCRLEAGYALDAERRACVVDADSQAGKDLNRIWRREIRAVEEHRRALEGYDRLELLHQAEVVDWKRKSSKAGAPPPDKPVKPICARLVCDSVTVEALADRMCQNPNGMLLAADELAGWLGGHNEYKAKKGSDTANWLRMWQAGTVFVDRKTGDKPTLHIPRAAVSIVGGIQPAILRAALGREHFADGLAARLLVAMPPRQARRWTEAEVPQSLQDDLERVLDGLLALAPERTGTDEVKPVPLTFDRDCAVQKHRRGQSRRRNEPEHR